MGSDLTYADILNSSVLLWGNGECGFDFLKVARELELNVLGFIDGLSEESYTMHEGREKVYSLKDLEWIGEKPIIIITSIHYKEIKKKIDEKHIKNKYLVYKKVLKLIAKNYIATLQYKNKEYRYGENKYFKYRYYIPENEKKMPLVIVLHGAGSRTDDNEGHVLMSNPLMQALGNYQKEELFAVFAPQCPRFRQWVDVPWSKGDFKIDLCKLQLADYVIQSVDNLSDTKKIDFTKIYIIGHSIGGYGAWYLGEKYYERINAIVPIAGGGDIHYAKHIMDMPIWAFHSDDDETVPVSGTDRMAEALEDSPHFIYTRYLDGGHDIFYNIFSKESSDRVLEWLFKN